MQILLSAARRSHSWTPSGQGWNPSDKGANIVLSGTSNVIATGGTGSWQTVRSVTSHASGKFVFEVQRTIDTSALTVGGLCNSAVSLSNYIGASGGEGVGYAMGNATNGLIIGTFTQIPGGISNIAVGDTQMWAVDITNKKAWVFCYGQSAWAGGGDPAAGTSPTVQWTTALTLFAGCSVFNTNGSVTLNTGQRAFQNSGRKPTGFSLWG